MASLTSEQLESEILAGRLRPAYLFHGEEEYLILRALARLKEAALAPGTDSLNFSEYSGARQGAPEILAGIRTLPMMSGRRMVVVSDLGELPADGLNELAAYLSAPHERTILVLLAAGLDRRMSTYRRLAEDACVVDFQKLKGAALQRWVRERVAKGGSRLSPAAEKKLIDLAGSDLLTLIGEIDKLLLYSGGGEIQESDVDGLIQASRQHGIFEFTGAVGRRDRKLALRLLGNLLECGEDHLGILAMTARTLRQILLTQELAARGASAQEIAKAIQMPEYYFQDFMRQAKAMDPNAAARLYERLARIDENIKSSRSEPRMLLEQFILSV